MSCPPDPPTFRLLDALVGWDPAVVEGLSGLDDPAGLTLAPLSNGITAESVSAAIPPAFLAKACDPCRWFLITCCPPASRLLRLDSCGDAWTPVWAGRCDPALAQCATAIAVHGDRIALSDPGARRVWVYRRSGEELAFSIPMTQPGPLAWSRRHGWLVTDQAAGRLRAFDPSGADTGRSWALPGPVDRLVVDRLAVDAEGAVWLLTGADDALLLWRLEPGQTTFVPASLAQLLAAFGDTGLRGAQGHHFCIEDHVDGTPRRRCFDCHGRPASATAQPLPPAFARQGQLLTLALDSGKPHCRWHRIRLDALVPPGTGLQVAVSSHDEPTPPAQSPATLVSGEWQGFAGGLPNPADWYAPPGDPLDFLIDQPPGRYLFVRIRMRGDGHTTPRLRRVRIDLPRQTSFDRLPAVFADNPVASDFGERFMALFDAAVEDMDKVIERYPALFDVAGAPSELLPWLASFLGTTLDSAWSVAERRAVIAALPGLFRRRGTPAGLKAALELLFGVSPVIAEPALARPWGGVGSARLGGVRLFGNAAARMRLGQSALGAAPVWSIGNPALDPLTAQAFRFEVMVPFAPAPALRQQIDRTIATQKPAHTVATLRTGASGLVIGQAIAVGIDTAFAALPAPVLGGGEGGVRLSRRSVLWSRHRSSGTSVRVGTASAVGIHTFVE